MNPEETLYPPLGECGKMIEMMDLINTFVAILSLFGAAFIFYVGRDAFIPFLPKERQFEELVSSASRIMDQKEKIDEFDWGGVSRAKSDEIDFRHTKQRVNEEMLEVAASRLRRSVGDPTGYQASKWQFGIMALLLAATIAWSISGLSYLVVYGHVFGWYMAVSFVLALLTLGYAKIVKAKL